MRRRRLVIVSPIRFFLSVLLITYIIGFIILVPFTQADTDKTYVQVEVSENETIWDIATAYSDESTDIRAMIDNICQTNNINPQEIMPGDTLFIPVE